MPTNPDRSCTYLVLRAHSDEQSVQLKPALEFPPGGTARGSSLDQHSEEHWPGGVKNKDDPWDGLTQGKSLGGEW